VIEEQRLFFGKQIPNGNCKEMWGGGGGGQSAMEHKCQRNSFVLNKVKCQKFLFWMSKSFLIAVMTC
jgi:hypothetical protein